MEEITIEEIRDMELKEIQRTINDLRKQKVAGNFVKSGNTGGMDSRIDPQELRQINKSIARCKTVMNERVN